RDLAGAAGERSAHDYRPGGGDCRSSGYVAPDFEPALRHHSARSARAFAGCSHPGGGGGACVPATGVAGFAHRSDDGFEVRMMRLFRILMMRFRSLLEKQQLDAELEDELRFHLENQIARNVESGMSPKEARETALRAFSGLTQRKEECRDARRLNLIEDLIQDIRYGFRMLGRNPS